MLPEMAPRSGTYRMANRLTGGKLADLLTEYRAAGLSWDDISRRLYGDFGVEVTAVTLQSWASEPATSDQEPGDPASGDLEPNGAPDPLDPRANGDTEPETKAS